MSYNELETNNKHKLPPSAGAPWCSECIFCPCSES